MSLQTSAAHAIGDGIHNVTTHAADELTRMGRMALASTGEDVVNLAHNPPVTEPGIFRKLWNRVLSAWDALFGTSFSKPKAAAKDLANKVDPKDAEIANLKKQLGEANKPTQTAETLINGGKNEAGQVVDDAAAKAMQAYEDFTTIRNELVNRIGKNLHLASDGGTLSEEAGKDIVRVVVGTFDDTAMLENLKPEDLADISSGDTARIMGFVRNNPVVAQAVERLGKKHNIDMQPILKSIFEDFKLEGVKLLKLRAAAGGLTQGEVRAIDAAKKFFMENIPNADPEMSRLMGVFYDNFYQVHPRGGKPSILTGTNLATAQRQYQDAEKALKLKYELDATDLTNTVNGKVKFFQDALKGEAPKLDDDMKHTLDNTLIPLFINDIEGRLRQLLEPTSLTPELVDKFENRVKTKITDILKLKNSLESTPASQKPRVEQAITREIGNLGTDLQNVYKIPNGSDLANKIFNHPDPIAELGMDAPKGLTKMIEEATTELIKSGQQEVDEMGEAALAQAIHLDTQNRMYFVDGDFQSYKINPMFPKPADGLEFFRLHEKATTEGKFKLIPKTDPTSGRVSGYELDSTLDIGSPEALKYKRLANQLVKHTGRTLEDWTSIIKNKAAKIKDDMVPKD